jgi:hypothetical protein
MERSAKLKKAAEAIRLALNVAESLPDVYLRAQPTCGSCGTRAFERSS